MGIKRNEVEEPQWTEWDYAVKTKEELFSAKRWRKTPDWSIILKQVERTRQASQMIDIRLYPSTLFFHAIDLLEANLYVIDDMFYYLTGMRLIGTKPRSEELKLKLGFWSMDSYKVLEQIEEGLMQAKSPLIECLKQEPLWDISLKVVEKRPLSDHLIGTAPVPTLLTEEECAYMYAREHYEADGMDQEALATQIVNILELAGHFAYSFFRIYGDFFDFSQLLALFCQSEKAQHDYIEPWRHDFGGTRDNLIAKMEKDQKLGPWVHRYDHLSKERSVPFQLFYDEKKLVGPVNKEECYNTDNWLSILTVAAVLQEYDELHSMPTPTAAESNKVDDDALLLKLSLCIKGDKAPEQFMKSALDLHNNKDIILLVKKYYDRQLIIGNSKDLYNILFEAKLYTKTYTNWRGQLNKLLLKESQKK